MDFNINIKFFREDLRRLAVTLLLGGLIAIFFHHETQKVGALLCFAFGVLLWYIGLSEWRSDKDGN